MSNIGVGAQPSNSQSSNADQPFGVLEESIDDSSNWKTETEFKIRWCETEIHTKEILEIPNF